MSQGKGYTGPVPGMIVGDKYVVFIDPDFGRQSSPYFTLYQNGIKVLTGHSDNVLPSITVNTPQASINTDMLSIAGLIPATPYTIQLGRNSSAFTTTAMSQVAAPTGLTYNVQGNNVFISWTSSSNVFNAFTAGQGNYTVPPWYTGTNVYVDGTLRFTQVKGGGMSATISNLSPGGHSISLVDTYFIATTPYNGSPVQMGPTITLTSASVGFSVTVASTVYQTLSGLTASFNDSNNTVTVSWSLGSTGATAPVTLVWQSGTSGATVTLPAGSISTTLGSTGMRVGSTTSFSAWVGPRPVQPATILVVRGPYTGGAITGAAVTSVVNGVISGTMSTSGLVSRILIQGGEVNLSYFGNATSFSTQTPVTSGSYHLYAIPLSQFQDPGVPFDMGTVKVPPSIANLSFDGSQLSWTVGEGLVDNYIVTVGGSSAIVSGTTTSYIVPTPLIPTQGSTSAWVQAQADSNLGASSSVQIFRNAGAAFPVFIGVKDITLNSATVFWTSNIPYDDATVSWTSRDGGGGVTSGVTRQTLTITGLQQGIQYEVGINERNLGFFGGTQTTLFTTLGNSFGPTGVTGTTGVTGATGSTGTTGATTTPPTPSKSFWEQYKWFILGGGGLALIVIIFIVVMIMRRR